ncbi:CHAD domain-containing protein [Teichococcus aestuarii]|uniref:CHAD domain-containing protein n=1 Tax=Teichococcus aestuarii TaxID=568898 RepID=UPI003605C0AA
MARRRRKLLKGGREIESLDDHALHELRLEAKRLRYVAELFAPLWPGKPARRFLRRIGALQEALGLSNDTVAARALVASLQGARARARRAGRSAWRKAGRSRRGATPGPPLCALGAASCGPNPSGTMAERRVFNRRLNLPARLG